MKSHPEQKSMIRVRVKELPDGYCDELPYKPGDAAVMIGQILEESGWTRKPGELGLFFLQKSGQVVEAPLHDFEYMPVFY